VTIFKQLSTETLQLVAGNFLSLSLGLISSILITRALGEEARGVYAWVFTLQGFACQLGALVTYQAARQLAAHHSQDQWPQLAGFIIILGLAGSLLGLPLLLYGLTEPTVGAPYGWLLLIAFIGVPFSAISVPLVALVHTRKHFAINTLTVISQRLFLLVGVLVLLAVGAVNLHGLTLLNILSAGVALGVVYAALRLKTPFNLSTLTPPRAMFTELKSLIGATWLAGLALFALPKIAILQLAASGQLAATGHLSVASTLFEAALAMPLIASSVLITHLTKRGANQAIRRKITLAMLGGTSLAAGVAAGLAPWVIPLLFGAPFTDAVAPFQLLMVCLVMAALHQAWFSRLVTARASAALILPPLMGCIAVFALGLALTHPYGAVGAALSTVGGYVVMVVITYTLKKQH
jgi:O-antigen/teichoic acid export membrane protein